MTIHVTRQMKCQYKTNKRMVLIIMTSQYKVKTMTIAALLSALGILIPLIAPKYVLPPASYTLASHVPIFIAMFISVPVSIFVTIVTAIGFFFGGYPFVVTLRAVSHIIFVVLGSYILSRKPNILSNKFNASLFALLISVVHGISEVLVVTQFYLVGNADQLYYEKGYLISVILLVGLGTVIHSLIDFAIAVFVWKPIQNILPIPVNVKLKNTRDKDV